MNINDPLPPRASFVPNAARLSEQMILKTDAKLYEITFWRHRRLDSLRVFTVLTRGHLFYAVPQGPRANCGNATTILYAVSFRFIALCPILRDIFTIQPLKEEQSLMRSSLKRNVYSGNSVYYTLQQTLAFFLRGPRVR